jgi:UDP-N-acetylmuramoyl-L-alanyl-D-glutamate--2,6-diaminopimelate ligase
VQVTAHGTTFRLIWPEGAIEVECPLLGRYNVSNLLAAFAACYALGRDPAVIAVRLKYFSSVPGRMERISAGSAAQVYVDYAHTPAAMRASLSLLRTLTPGRLLVVYGCGGQRDRSLRAQLTKIVQEIADQVWVTADNPRAEPLSQIFADQQAGVIAAERIAFVPDRREAIRQALAAARVGDCVLIAGKGHEIYQKLADTIVPFDDRQVARELLASSLG